MTFRNNTFDFINIPDVSDSYSKSFNDFYFIIYENSMENFSLEIVKSSFQDFNKSFLEFNEIEDSNSNLFLSRLESDETTIFNSINIFHLRLNEEELRILESAPRIFKILPDRNVKALGAKRIPPEDVNKTIPKNWGLIETGVLNSRKTGEGVKVAILDTGYDPDHPGYTNRIPRPVVKGIRHPNSVKDYNGHGMHCLGIACGDSDDNDLKYGIAHKSEIYIGKVLNNLGKGEMSSLIKGIYWAVEQGCHVISISIGTIREPDNEDATGSLNIAYERAIADAFENNCIVVAGVGNDSDRKNTAEQPHQVTLPAAVNSCYAVSSIDFNKKIQNSANRACQGQKIWCVAPGVQIYSSVSNVNGFETYYDYMTGTSMATPHVAGILALIWQDNLDKSANDIVNLASQYKFEYQLTWEKIDYGNGIIKKI